MRTHDRKSAVKNGSEIRQMCEGLRESGTAYACRLVLREQKRLEPRIAT